MIRVAVVSLLFLAGCFDSLLGSPCRAGLKLHDGQCVAEQSVADGGTNVPDSLTLVVPDAGSNDSGMNDSDAGTSPDGSPDAQTCTADLQTDPSNCGVCGHACVSGICTSGICEGDPRGHVVAIGHDFVASNAPMMRVLGNAAALGAHHDLAIARWSAPSANVTAALASSLAQLGRPSHTVTLPGSPSMEAFEGVDVIVVDPRSADGVVEEATGVAWNAAFSEFLLDGGVVIVLEGGGGTNHRFARGAGLFLTTTPVVVTGAHLQVFAPTDAVAQQVISPYYAASSTVAFPLLSPVVAAPATPGAVVFHVARP